MVELISDIDTPHLGFVLSADLAKTTIHSVGGASVDLSSYTVWNPNVPKMYLQIWSKWTAYSDDS